MSIMLQWIIVAACLAAAVGYLLFRLGLFALFGGVRPRRSGACSACPHCAAAEQLARQIQRE